MDHSVKGTTPTPWWRNHVENSLFLKKIRKKKHLRKFFSFQQQVSCLCDKFKKKKDHTSRSGQPALNRWPLDMQSNALTLSFIPNYTIWVLINLIYSMIEPIKHLKVDNVCFFYFKQLCNITDGRRHWIAAVPSLENIRAHQSFST